MTSRTALCAALLLFCVAFVVAHPDDPKERDRMEAYQGPGFRSSHDAEPAILFPSQDVALLAWLPVGEFGGQMVSAADCWGYVSPSQREYAIIGLSDGTAWVEVTDPGDPAIVAVLAGPTSTWRDIKVYQDHAYAVSEGGSGIQVFDMSGIDGGTVALVNTITTGGTTATHNVAIDETSGFLYRCGGAENGLRIYSLANPAAPAFVGSWPDRYVHDTQVVTYTSGPYAGRQIAFCCGGFNGGFVDTGLDIVDVTVKSNIQHLAHLAYPQGAYSHQGWLSPDRTYFYLGDELDEGDFNIDSTTHVINVADIDNPFWAGSYTNGSTAITHNLYTLGNLIVAANYRSGLRVFDATNPLSPVEIAWFDTFPTDDAKSFNSLWNAFPYFPSGTIIGSDIERGLFVWQLGAPALQFQYPNGLPAEIAPGGDSIDVEIIAAEGDALDPATAMLQYDVGDGPVASALTHVGGSLFTANFPQLDCGTLIEYHFTAQTTGGVSYRDPLSAADEYEAISALGFTNEFTDDFEANLGWTVTNELGLADGPWERGVPIGGGDRGDPPTDADGSGQCYLTDNADGNSDVDGGFTMLTSPVMDATAGEGDAYVSYWRWYSNNLGVVDDVFVIEVSDDGGASWSTLETIGPAGPGTGGGWIHAVHRVADVVAETNQFRIRFIADDAGQGSVVEAGVDGVMLRSIECGPQTVFGDVTGDDVVGVDDFLAVLAAWGPCPGGCPPSCPEDFVGDDCTVGVEEFLSVLANWTL